jgi:hypothetical protein
MNAGCRALDLRNAAEPDVRIVDRPQSGARRLVLVEVIPRAAIGGRTLHVLTSGSIGAHHTRHG